MRVVALRRQLEKGDWVELRVDKADLPGGGKEAKAAETKKDKNKSQSHRLPRPCRIC